MTKQEKLDNLKQQIFVDNPCPELAETANNIVFGSGSANAEIVFVGEAPGKKEDESGEPFVGASGKFLNEMLKENNIKRKDVYITNIVKYRPPNNRDPLDSEKTAFWPFLLEQIRIIKPKVVATLGRHSGLAFNQSLRISADHGKPQRGVIKISQDDNSDENIVFLPLYHPAAAIYNRSLRDTLKQDFALLKELIK
jgi:uracil-DNA glycosylase